MQAARENAFIFSKEVTVSLTMKMKKQPSHALILRLSLPAGPDVRRNSAQVLFTAAAARQTVPHLPARLPACGVEAGGGRHACYKL